MSETTSACVRGCNLRDRHLAECEGACWGCLPRRAQYGRLCWPCHRRLELMLTDAETVDRWLTGNLPTGGGAVADDIHVTSSRDAPVPIKVHIFDKRQELRDHWATWVDWLCERHDLHGPDRHSVNMDAGYLLSFIGKIECWSEIDDLWEQSATLLSDAHSLAPWRPAMRRVGTIPCPECEAVNLAIFGGETDVTCLSCRTMIHEKAFGLWEQIVRNEHGIGETA